MGAMASAWAWRRRVSSTAAMPPSRSCLRARSSSIRFILYLLGFVIDEVAVLHQFADQGIDLVQAEWGLRTTFQIAADEAVFMHAHFERGGAGFIDCRGAVLLGQGQHAQDAAHADFALLCGGWPRKVYRCASGAAGAAQQLRSAQRCLLGVVLVLDAIPAALLAHVFAQQLPGLGIEQANIQLIPLHSQQTPDPARRSAVVGGFDFDAAIQMHDALAVLVIAERLQRAAAARRVSLRRTWRRLAVWWCRGCACRPSVASQ